MKRIVVPFEFDKKASDVKKGIVVGYASAFGNVDSYREVMEPGCFADSITEKGPDSTDPRIKVLWQHDWDRPIGLPKVLSQDSTGLMTESQLAQTSTVTGEYMPLLESGVVDRMSIGFMEGTTRHNEETGYIHHLMVDLWEYSFVTFPANWDAKITDVRTRTLENARRAMSLPASTAELAAADAKYAMAVLMGARGAGSFSDMPESQREELYRELCAAYLRHSLTPPSYMPVPAYATIGFQHDERIVFEGRFLQKRLSDVTDTARRYAKLGGTLPPELAAQAQTASDAVALLGSGDVSSRIDRIQRRKAAEQRLGIRIA